MPSFLMVDNITLQYNSMYLHIYKYRQAVPDAKVFTKWYNNSWL